MPTRNCFCGLVAAANCVRCGAGTCTEHMRSVKSRLRLHWQGDFGLGATLAEAAFDRGYRTAPADRFVCHTCRTEDARQHQRTVALKEWPKDPFGRALVAIVLGYLYLDIGLTRLQLAQGWIKLGVRPVAVTVQRMIKGEKPGGKTWYGGVRPSQLAQYVTETVAGWTFPGTVYVYTGSAPRTDRPIWKWADATTILPDGRVTPEYGGGRHPPRHQLAGSTPGLERLVVAPLPSPANAWAGEWGRQHWYYLQIPPSNAIV